MKLFHLHKWKYVYKKHPRTFLSEDVADYERKFRICKRCGAAEELTATFNAIFWDRLDNRRALILKRKIRDFGRFYVLMEEEK